MIKELTFLYELVLEGMDKGHLPFQDKRDALIAHLETLKNGVEAEAKTVVADTAEKIEETVESTPETSTEVTE